MADPTPADPVIEPPRMSRLPRISLAWIVPIVALAVSLGVAWRTYSARGPIIEILFDNAAGIVPAETTLRFRDFTIGLVEGLGFNADLTQVVARVRLQRDIAEYIDAETTFWLVRAQVGPRGITGLETVLSGAYIEASFDNVRGKPQDRFVALPRPPLTPAGQPGMRLNLTSASGGSIAPGAPVLFKQIPVGKIETVELTPQGEVAVSAFIDAPHHLLLSTATRFWNASGFTFELGAGGATLSVDSLASLVQGGIAFDSVAALGAPISGAHVFRLYENESIARNSLLTGADWENPVRLATVFDGSVRGLRVGSDVEYRGLRVGEVSGIQAHAEEDAEGPRVRLYVTMDVLPNRFGIPEDDGAEAAVFDLIEAGVERGLRARVASQGLLGGALYVDFVELEDAPPATFDRNELPAPTVPSAPNETNDLMAIATGFAQRIAELPIEDVVRSASTLLGNVNSLVEDEGVQQAPAELAALLASARTITDEIAERQVAGSLAETLQAATRTLGSVGTAADGLPAAVDSVVAELRPLLADLREGGAAENVNATLAAIRGVADEIAAAQLAQSLRATLTAVEGAVGNVSTASDGLPELLANLTALSQEARALPLAELVASGRRTLDSADALIASEAVAGIPPAVAAALAEIRAILAELRQDGGALDNAAGTLAAFRTVADEIAAAQLAASIAATLTAVEGAVGDVGTAAEGLPELLASLTALSEEARALPLEQLVASGTRALDSADAILAGEAATQLPVQVNAALSELRLNLANLREGGAVDNANATLVAVRSVAEEIAAAQLAASIAATLTAVEGAVGDVGTAAEGLPELLASLTALSEEARELPLEQLVSSGTRTLDSADAILAGEAATQLPVQVNAALSELRLNLANLREGGAVDNANATLAAARRVAEEIAAARLAESLRTALTAVEGAVGDVSTAAEGLPELLASLTALSEEARALPLEDLVAAGARVMATADAFLASEAVTEVPASVNTALAELRLILADLRTGGAVENVNASLVSVRAVADELAAARLTESLRNTFAAAEGAIGNINIAAEDLPALLASLTALSQRAGELPLDELVASGRQVLDTADRLLASDGMAEVPPRLAGALAELRLVLAELREGGAVENVNATLASADEAARAIATAVETLPALVAQLSQTAARAELALASFSPGSDINRDTLLLLREVREAARSVNSLVTALERRPNSVLFGR